MKWYHSIYIKKPCWNFECFKHIIMQTWHQPDGWTFHDLVLNSFFFESKRQVVLNILQMISSQTFWCNSKWRNQNRFQHRLLNSVPIRCFKLNWQNLDWQNHLLYKTNVNFQLIHGHHLIFKKLFRIFVSENVVLWNYKISLLSRKCISRFVRLHVQAKFREISKFQFLTWIRYFWWKIIKNYR